MTEREKMIRETREEMNRSAAEMFRREKEAKRLAYRQRNAYIRKGQVLFTGSSLMEQFPISEYCCSEGLPTVYNRGIGGYTTDEFIEAIDDVLLDPRPSRLFINIGTNDIRFLPDGEEWLPRLEANYRKICAIIRDGLPDTTVYMMAYYPVNEEKMRKADPRPQARTNANVEKANRMTEALAAEFGFNYIDVNDGLKDERGELRAEHTEDGIHFDPEAYRTVFERLKKYLT